jgi:hypothetical protein
MRYGFLQRMNSFKREIRSTGEIAQAHLQFSASGGFSYSGGFSQSGV